MWKWFQFQFSFGIHSKHFQKKYVLIKYIHITCSYLFSCPGSSIPDLGGWVTDCHFWILTQRVTFETWDQENNDIKDNENEDNENEDNDNEDNDNEDNEDYDSEDSKNEDKDN